MEIGNFNDFVFSSNIHNDIACLKNMKIVNGRKIINSFISYNMLATKEDINKLSVCDSIAYPGFPEWYDHQKGIPIFRMGSIASDPRINYSYNANEPDSEKIAYEGFSSRGASGSPVFSLQKGFPLGKGLKCEGSEEFYKQVMLIGINAGHFSDEGVHSGISYFYKSTAIIDIINDNRIL